METGGAGFSLGTVNVTVPQTVPNREHSAIRQMGKTSAYTCKGYLAHPAAQTGSREPVDVMVDSGNTTAAISLACATRLGLSWGATAPRKIATASRKKASLIVRGEIRNLCLRLEERKEPLLLQNAWIIDKLNSDVNLGVKFLQQHNVILDWTSHKGNRPVLRLPGEENETMGTMAAAGGETTGPTEALDVPVSKLAEVLTNLRYQKRKPVDQGGPFSQ